MDDRLEDLKITLQDLVDISPRSLYSDSEAREAAAWLSMSRGTEEKINEYYDGRISEAHHAHINLVAEKRSFLGEYQKAKDRVRAMLSGWLAAGNKLRGFSIREKFSFEVVDMSRLPEEFLKKVVDEEKLKEWISTTKGDVPVPGVEIRKINILVHTEKRV